MKQLTILILFFLPFCVFSQEGTTLEEYRYLSKGYVYQLEMGLDADKDGYSVKKLFTASNEAKLIGLYKNGQSDARAILVIVPTAEQKPLYICIPNQTADERVMSLYQLDQKNLGQLKFKGVYEKAMQEFLFAAISDGSVPTDEVVMKNAPVIPSSFENNDILSTKGDQTPNVIISPAVEPIEKVETAPKQKTKLAKQNTSGEISGRNILYAPDMIVSAYKKGLVAVKICVNTEGQVTSAKFTQKGSTTFDRKLKQKAVDSASKYRFSKSDIPEQCGIITFKF